MARPRLEKPAAETVAAFRENPNTSPEITAEDLARAADAAAENLEPLAPDDVLPPPHVEVIDYLCGLRKVGPSKYVIVAGRIIDGVPELAVDTVAQSIDHAAEELLATFRKLMETIP